LKTVCILADMRLLRIGLSSLLGVVGLGVVFASPVAAGSLPNHNETVVRLLEG